MLMVQSDLAKAIKQINALREGLGTKAAVRALNRVGQMAQTEAKRAIKNRYSYPARDVSNTLRMQRANAQRIEVTISSKGRRIPLIKLSPRPRQTKKGVSIRMGQNRSVILGAFIAKMKSGHEGVFIRKTKKSLPIKELYTIAVPEAFAGQQVSGAMMDVVNKRLVERFKHEVEWLIRSSN